MPYNTGNRSERPVWKDRGKECLLFWEDSEKRFCFGDVFGKEE